MKTYEQMKNELDVLDYLLHYLKMDDIEIWFNENGVIQAEDADGVHWEGRELYEFITYEALDFDENGNFLPGCSVPDHLLKPYKALSVEYGVIPGAEEVEK